MKFKESLKNLVLAMLVISSMTLTWKIWFSEELWPDGYNSFPYEENIFSVAIQKVLSYFRSDEANTALDYNQLFYPKQLRVNQDGKKELLTPASDHFEQLNQQIGEVLHIFMQDSTVSKISGEELKKAYRAPSLYVDFYQPISADLIRAYFGGDLPGELDELESVEYLALSLQNDEQTMTLYLTDNDTATNYQLIASNGMEELKKTVAQVMEKSTAEGLQSNSHPFSFESNFDQPSQETGARMPIHSYTVISLLPQPIKAAQSELLLQLGDNQTTTTFNRLIEAFSINLGSARRFTDSVGAYNYVENFAALTIHPDGLLEYTATNAEKGISLDTHGTDGYGMITEVGEFVNVVNSLIPNRANPLAFHSMEELSRDQYRYTFHYLADGIPVWMQQELPNGKRMESAIEVVVEDRHIVSYRQIFTNIRTTEQILAHMSAIDAMDGFYNIYQGKMDGIQIDDFYMVYRYQNGAVIPQWVFCLSNDKEIIFDIGETE